MTGEQKSFLISLGAHAALIGSFVLFGAFEAVNEDFSSNSDIVLILGDDPNKDAGLVDRERGAAKGTADGKINDPRESEPDHKFADNSLLEEIIRQNEQEALAAQEVQKNEESVKQPPRVADNKKSDKKSSEKKQDKTKNTAKSDKGPKRVNINNHRESVKNNGGNAKSGNGAARVPVKISTGTIGGRGASGTQNGKSSGGVFGRPDGIGENGGDGGKRIGDARVAYCNEIDQRFTTFFRDLYPSAQLELTETLFVDVRFSVDARGNVKLLEVIGNKNPSVHKFIEKVFKAAFSTRFKTPPENKAFTGKLERIEFRVG
ncbi:MAG: hypothetical protein K6B46_04010 [Opitutales bacterium]|nr:hypothetical protein [Opitutales bacterium]